MIERGVRLVAVLCAAAACVAVVLLAGRLLHEIDDRYWVFADLVDARVEAGEPAVAIDPADPLLRQRTIVVTAGINERTAAHVVPRLLYLSAVDPTAPIDLVVMTKGGWRDTAFAIIDAMRMIDAPVNTWAIGECASAGALIVAGGTGERVATPNAMLMVHGNLEHDPEPFGEASRSFERERRFWEAEARLPADWELDGDEEYYVTAEEAQAYGIVDAVRARRAHPAGR